MELPVTAGEVRHAMRHLRDMCDPRGHDLLDAIEDTLIAQLDAQNVLVAEMRYAVEQLQQPADTHDHSKSAELRVVS